MRLSSLLLVTILVAGCAPTSDTAPASGTDTPASGSTHDDLVSFFHAWREFQKPPVTDGVPDYGPAAMESQHRSLASWQSALADFDTTGWTIAERADWHLVAAEMNGLDFDHRVLRPWATNPYFYIQIWTSQSDTPAHEGPTNEAFIDLWTYEYPLSDDEAAELAARIRTIPPFLQTARTNLTGDARDLWTMGAKSMDDQAANLDRLADRVAGTSDELDEAIAAAAEASRGFADWIEAQLPGKTGSSGVGREHYDWYLRNVHLSPYTWEHEVRIMRQELARAYTSLRLEENRNRDLPVLQPIDDPETFDRLMNAAVDDFVAFFDREDIMETKPYFAPALRAKIGGFSPEGPQSFFAQVNYRDPMVMRTHGYHWVELARMEHEPHPDPIRAVPALYNIWDSRSEGLATAMEEMMMDAGLFDGSPRTRELIWILIAQRAARAISGLMMHANEWTLDEAAAFASAWTPRGWMKADGDLVQFEQHLYLIQPGYGSSYLAGKAQLRDLFLQRQHQLGDRFTVRRYFDELNTTGVIPVSLVRWELTGDEATFRDIDPGS